jgi:uncharacterized protein (DUF4213/DUF364 family)
MSAKAPKPAEQLVAALLEEIPDGTIQDVRIGLHWTAVVAQVEGRVRCGLCSTVNAPSHHRVSPRVPEAGDLEQMAGRNLAALALDRDNQILASLGVAALNALLPPPPRESWIDGNAEQILAFRGRGKRVAIVGHFPFTSSLREKVDRLDVLELRPEGDDHPADAAPQLIPRAQVVAITSMALPNHTLAGLLQLCAPEATVMLLGPSTPLSPTLFDYGIDLLSGSMVESIEPVLKMISQGANFRQVHRAGVRLMTIASPRATWIEELEALTIEPSREEGSKQGVAS